MFVGLSSGIGHQPLSEDHRLIFGLVCECVTVFLGLHPKIVHRIYFKFWLEKKRLVGSSIIVE